MFQERAPWTLVTGEEHFTSLGYHSERWCQGQRENFFGPWRVGCLVGITHRTRCHSLTAAESAGHGAQRAILCRAGDESNYQMQCLRSVGGPTSRSSEIIHLEVPDRTHQELPGELSARTAPDRAEPSPETYAGGLGVLATVPRIEPLRKPRDPQSTAPLTDSPHEAGDPPDYSISQESGPLGTYHRGGTFYVLRLPQRTVVSRPARKLFGSWREGHVAGITVRSRSLAQSADRRARNRCAA